MSDMQYFKKDGTVYQIIDGTVRREDPGMTGTYREWHANGILAKESTRIDRVTTGVAREWHDNGVLAKETPYQHGLVHGTVRQWNREGKLLGEYKMTYGRGIGREWNNDGSPRIEFEQISESGRRGIVWDDLGKPHEVYLWNGKLISKKKFLERLAKENKAYEP